MHSTVRPASASESLTGSGEKPAGLPVVLRGGPNPHSWRLCQASRLSVTLVGGMQAAHANSLRPDWGNASRLLISESLPVREVLISLIWASFFFPSVETSVVWRFVLSRCPPSPEKSQVSGPQDIRHGHDGEPLIRGQFEPRSFQKWL